MTLHPDLEALGRPDLLAGFDPTDVGTLDQTLVAAVHEAAHHVLRVVTDVPGGDLMLHGEGGLGVSLPAQQEVPAHKLAEYAQVLTAGLVAEYELIGRVLVGWRHPDAGAWDGENRSTWVDPDEAPTDIATLASLPAWVVHAWLEPLTLALVRSHWDDVLAVAHAVLASPHLRLTWTQTVALVDQDRPYPGDEANMIAAAMQARAIPSILESRLGPLPVIG